MINRLNLIQCEKCLKKEELNKLIKEGTFEAKVEYVRICVECSFKKTTTYTPKYIIEAITYTTHIEIPEELKNSFNK